jgi:heme/copper-type cytochrome/quinol oxidase subunit 2
MGNQNFKWGIWVGVGIVIVIILLVVFHGAGNSGNPVGSGNSPVATAPSAPQTSPTHAAPPPNIVAPSEGAKNVPAGTAVPSVQVPASPDTTSSFRSFSIKISNNAYTPSTVIVNQGDVVDLEITAIDANYAFTQPDYGFNAAIPKGKTQKIQFQALQSGKFTFYCGTCGGPAKGPVGYIIVAAKSQ